MSKYIPSDIVEAQNKAFLHQTQVGFEERALILLNQPFSIKMLLSTISWTTTRHQAIHDHLSGRVNRRLLIWSLLNVEYWIQEIFDIYSYLF